MKYYELTKEEQTILDSFEQDEWVSLPDLKDRLQESAQATLAKTKNINLRLSAKTLLKLKAKSARLGIPYQTLATSLIHRFVES